MNKIKNLVYGPPKPKNIAVDFMTMCYEGCTADQLDALFLSAVKKNSQAEIRDCQDYEGNKPWHKAAKHSNYVALQWIIGKWKEMDWELRFDQHDY